MLAETQENKAVQLASLGAIAVDLRPDAGAVRIPDFNVLIAKMEAKLPQADRPQRRVFAPSDLETRNPKPETYTNLYLALVSNPKSKIENPKSQDDLDPIYTYDLNGNRTSMIDPTGITTYTYDALNRLTSITNNKGFTTSFTYDSLGRRTSMTHGNGVVTTYQYDAASQLTRLAHQLGAMVVNSFDYTYDRVGNRTSKMSRDGVHNYTYDTLNRLIEAINPLPTNPLETYRYDAVGNRTNSNQNGSSTFTSVFNAANQLLEDANFTYQYDANGNLTRKTNKTTGEITSYEYTAENQLVRVVKNGTVINYRYDGLGRRVEKETNDGATTKVTRYILDQEDVLLELDGSNNIVARYTHGPGIDEPLILEKSGQSFFYHADGLGSITEITDSAGALKQQYTYSSFGKIESQLDPNFIQPYTFTSREFDPETGLYHYRHREYDSTTGRFNTTDPAGFGGRDVNLYPYVKNNPANLIDPDGLDILFAGFGASAFISLKPQGTTRGIGKQVTIGIAFDTETWTVKLFQSVGVACPTEPRDMVTGFNIGIGGVGGQLKGSFEDFFGESTEDTLTIGPFSRTKIITASGKEGIAIAGGGKGIGLSSTIITTETAPLNLGFLQRLLIQNALKGPAR